MTKIPRGEERIKYKKRPIPVKYTVTFFILVSLVVSIFYGYVGFYQKHWHTGTARTIANILPLPAANVDGDVVWFEEIVELSAILSLSSGDDESPSDNFDRALEMAIDRKHVVHLAAELGVGADQDDVDNYQIEDAEIEKFLEGLGWNKSDYKRYVIEPLLLYQAVEDAAYLSRGHQKVAFAEMESIKENVDLGVTFADLAKQYSDDSSSVLGGDVGYFKLDEFDNDLKEIFDLEVNEASEILEADEYFVIAKVYDVIFDGEERDQVGVRIITVDKNDLKVVLDEYKKGKTVEFFVK